MPVIFFINHSGDTIFFLNLIRHLDLESDKIVFLINRRYSNTSISRLLKDNNISSIDVDFGETKRNFFKRLISLKKSKSILKRNAYLNPLLISRDKSKLSSRLALKIFINHVLIQNEERTDILTLDLFGTFRESIKSMCLGLMPILVYSDNNRYSRLLKPLTPYRILYLNKGKSLWAEKKAGGKIVYFGSRFYDWGGFANIEEVEVLVVDIIKLILKKNPNQTIKYIKHPRESNKEIAFLKYHFGEKIELIDNISCAEEYLMKNKIKQTYSIGSTASMNANLMGIESYVMYKLLDIDGSIKSHFDLVFSGFPEKGFITSKEKLIEYRHKFQNLDKLFISQLNIILGNDKRHRTQ